MNRTSLVPNAYVIFIALATIGLTAFADPATQTALNPAETVSGPLRITVTAVQGGSQYRIDSTSHWQKLAVGLELSEGSEIRTGPRGSVQFTIGTDQVFRVDRLSVVKVLRANLSPDGTIRTDVGMTYGRVSKDVDLPEHPHLDTIETPSSTLAVRGTHVAMYDQPPYEPEAVSLTGLAYYKNPNGQGHLLGQKGGPPANVIGLFNGPAFSGLNNNFVNPNGYFSGSTNPETTTGIFEPGTIHIIGSTPQGVPPASQLTGGGTIMSTITGPSFTSTQGSLDFVLDSDGGSITFTVAGPSGSKSETSTNSQLELIFGGATGSFAGGTYTLTAKITAEGSTAVTPNVTQNPPSGADAGSTTAFGTTTFLSTGQGSSSTSVYRVTAPITEDESITLISGNSNSASAPNVEHRRPGR